MDEWTDVAAADAVRRSGMLEAEAGGQALLLVTVDGAIHAVAAVCPHHQAWLSMGTLDGDAIDCPRHQGRFHIVTGARLSGPACPPLPVYPVREQHGRVFVGLSNAMQTSSADAVTAAPANIEAAEPAP
jgi:nitrite reductase/ring-hydroxylating ferredoxin subunit